MKKSLIASCAAMAMIASPAQADIVTDWAELGRALSSDDNAGWSEDSYFTSTQLAIAMFEAANAIDRQYESYVGMDAAPVGASLEAAVITAAYTVLAERYPRRKADIDGSYELALERIINIEAREAGIEVGKTAAAAAMTTGMRDKDKALIPYRPSATPGVWVPTRLPVIRDEIPLMPLWSIESVDAYMPPPPLSIDSEEYARDLNEVKMMGGKQSEQRNSVESRIARYRITPVMTPTIEAIADMPGRSTVQNARMLMLFNMAGDDTGIVTGAAKLHYNFWRPVTAIRNADKDGNDATERDAGWESFIGTPNHPEYPCAHCSWASAVATVLEAEVGDAPPGGVQVGSRSLDFAVVQVLPSFAAWVADVSRSRMLGGVHYRFSNDAAEALGKRIATETLKVAPPLAE